ncbi:TraB/GumN family protein [Alisedimentitalea sp. MJ-SS2]|uniref:TraB/GumN family protein n=1 Tax=Aliisedimentitalea sp. MJ-SS2 TaxID=3049795 RepID=UPI00290613BA|nr:TraB/GumN family protein [Alisedimentitalea sp. MJ-SS2]MDU8927264.1 TraB/GumN family protein [Alisedimentitalea sp. MJ-SS2]
MLLLASPLRAFECGGNDLLPQMPTEDRLRLEARAGIAPYPEGLFWRATRGDTVLTIFGTYHIAHDRTDAQLDALLPHAQAADFSYFEMGYDDMQAFELRAKTDATVMFITDGPTLPEMLDETDWQRLRTLMSDRGMPSFMVAKVKPIFVSMFLGMSPCQFREQSKGTKGIDARLSEALADTGHETRSIEDPMTAVRVLDSFSQEEQVDMIKLSLDLPHDPDDLQTTLLNMYQAGKIALLWEYGRMLSIQHGGTTATEDFGKFEQVLLTRRNHEWIEEIEARAIGHEVFVAVGAGHLPGDDGILNLLSERGFAIERLSLSQN